MKTTNTIINLSVIPASLPLCALRSLRHGDGAS